MQVHCYPVSFRHVLLSAVKIESREVVVYPDDLPEPKPEVGEELNKRAIVSLHGFWPKDKQTHTPIKDRDRIQRMNYTKKLQGLVEKIGGSFVDYKHQRGTCEFEVSVTWSGVETHVSSLMQQCPVISGTTLLQVQARC